MGEGEEREVRERERGEEGGEEERGEERAREEERVREAEAEELGLGLIEGVGPGFGSGLL